MEFERKLQDKLCLAVRKKTRVIEHVEMQPIGKYGAPCDCPIKQWRDHKISSHELARENQLDVGQSSNKSCRLNEIYFR